MTLDQLQQRDRRIATLEALGRARSDTEQDELGRLREARDQFWRRLPDAAARARRKARDLAAYAAQHRLPIGDVA